MTKLVSTLFKGLNVFVVALYMVACLIPFLPTGQFWMIAILGLIFPILFFVVAAFFAGWIVARSKWFLLSLAALLISWRQISVVVGLNTDRKFTLVKTDSTLRVFTWNVSGWDQTSRSRVATANSNKQMIELVKKQQADVLCFQEFYDRMRETGSYSIVKAFKDIGYSYSYFVKSNFSMMNFKSGVAIFSKYPIVDTAKFTYGEKDLAEHLIYADILYRNQRVRVFTTHLQSVHFQNEQYINLSKIKHTDESGLKGSGAILSKLKLGYYYRGSQADLVREKIQESPYPVIVCGDFNDVPNSYTYFKIKGNLQDAFLEKGNKFGRTFRYLSPTLRIDYILADKELAVLQFNRIIAPYSDHYSIVADFNITSPK